MPIRSDLYSKSEIRNPFHCCQYVFPSLPPCMYLCASVHGVFDLSVANRWSTKIKSVADTLLPGFPSGSPWLIFVFFLAWAMRPLVVVAAVPEMCSGLLVVVALCSK